MLILTHSQVRELLPMRECMKVVREALAGLARGEGVQPLRSGFLLPDRQGVLAWMPGSLAAGQPFGIKVLSVVDNPGELGVDSHQGGVMIFDPTTGTPLALLEAGAITAVRTAAVSALATDRLARRDASTLAILAVGTAVDHGRNHGVHQLPTLSVGPTTPENADQSTHCSINPFRRCRDPEFDRRSGFCALDPGMSRGAAAHLNVWQDAVLSVGLPRIGCYTHHRSCVEIEN